MGKWADLSDGNPNTGDGVIGYNEAESKERRFRLGHVSGQIPRIDDLTSQASDKGANIVGFDGSAASLVSTTVSDGIVEVATMDISLTEARIIGELPSSKLADGAVTTSKINDGDVTEAKIANNAVTASKIPDGSITQTKLDFDPATQVELDNHKNDVANPHAVTKSQVSLGNVVNELQLTVAGSQTAIANLPMGDNRIVDLADPINSTDAVNLQTNNSIVAAIGWKAPVRAASTANLALTGEYTHDGVALVSGDRVLVKDQSTQTENGLYEVSAGAWARTSDADEDSEMISGFTVRVLEGTVNAQSEWTMYTSSPITLESSNIIFTTRDQYIESLIADNPREYTKQQGFGLATLTDAANISWNLDDAQVAEVTLAGNRTLDNPTNIQSGTLYYLYVKQDATGSRTLSYDTAYDFGDAGLPTLTTTASKGDLLQFIGIGTSMKFVGITTGYSV